MTVMLPGDTNVVNELHDTDVDKIDGDAATSSVVLFDFDGVLIHGDAFYLFIRERYLRSLWRSLLALLCTPLLLLQLPFSRRLPVGMLVRIALLGLGEKRYALYTFCDVDVFYQFDEGSGKVLAAMKEYSDIIQKTCRNVPVDAKERKAGKELLIEEEQEVNDVKFMLFLVRP